MDTENTYQGITHDFGLLLNEMYMEIKLFFFFFFFSMWLVNQASKFLPKKVTFFLVGF